MVTNGPRNFETDKINRIRRYLAQIIVDNLIESRLIKCNLNIPVDDVEAVEDASNFKGVVLLQP